MEWQNSQVQSSGLAPRTCACKFRGPWRCGHLSENTNPAYVSGRRYCRTDLQTVRRTLQDMNKGASVRRLLKILSLDIVSLMAVECPGGLMGHGRVFLSGHLARSQEFGVIL